MGLHLRFRIRLLLDRLSYLTRGVPLECEPQYRTEGRASPYTALRFQVRARDALLCHGRPSRNGRLIFGGLVPFGELWRTGADEPTTLHLPFRASVAGVDLRRGRYSLYTIPHPDRWTLVVNRSVRQAGRTREEVGRRGNRFPDAYTEVVRGAEVARVPVGARHIEMREQLTFRAEVVGDGRTDLLLEWEETQVRIPVEARAEHSLR